MVSENLTEEFYMSVSELFDWTRLTLQKCVSEEDHVVEAKKLFEFAQLYSEKTKSSQTGQMREILYTLVDADPDRIANDSQYRKEKILELCRTSVAKTLETAMELAKHDQIDESLVCFSFLHLYIIGLVGACTLVIYQ